MEISLNENPPGRITDYSGYLIFFVIRQNLQTVFYIYCELVIH